MVGSGSSTRGLVGHDRFGGLKRWSTNRQGWWRLRRCSSRVVRYQGAVLVLLEAQSRITFYRSWYMLVLVEVWSWRRTRV